MAIYKKPLEEEELKKKREPKREKRNQTGLGTDHNPSSSFPPLLDHHHRCRRCNRQSYMGLWAVQRRELYILGACLSGHIIREKRWGPSKKHRKRQPGKNLAWKKMANRMCHSDALLTDDYGRPTGIFRTNPVWESNSTDGRQGRTSSSTHSMVAGRTLREPLPPRLIFVFWRSDRQMCVGRI